MLSCLRAFHASKHILPTCCRHSQNAIPVSDDLVSQPYPDTTKTDRHSNRSHTRFHGRKRALRLTKNGKTSPLKGLSVSDSTVNDQSGNLPADTLQRHQLTEESYPILPSGVADKHCSRLCLHNSAVQGEVVAQSTAARKCRA